MNYNRILSFLPLTILALNLTTQAVAADVPLPQVATSLSGKMAYEAFLEVLKLENIPQVLGQFKPIQPGMEWTSHPVTTRKDISTLHLSFRPAVPEPQEKNKGGMWGYFKGAVSDTVSAVGSLGTNFLFTGDFIGAVTRSELSSARKVDGIRLDMELSQSSLAISSLVTHFSIEVVLKDMGTPEVPVVQVQIDSAMSPGVMFPGIRDPKVGPFIDTQLNAWIVALKSAALEQQARFIKESSQLD